MTAKSFKTMRPGTGNSVCCL